MARPDEHTRAAIAEAQWLRREVDTFHQSFPPLNHRGTPMPAFSWEELERQLMNLSALPANREVSSTLVSAVRKRSHFQPPEMVLRQCLCLASVVMDEAFDPPGEEEAEMP